MSTLDIRDSRAGRAISAITAGNSALLAGLITEYPQLVSSRFINGEEGYFKEPYLLWFIADNPIRNGKLPQNIIEISRILLEAVKREAPGTYRFQIDYALGLIATGSTPRECGVQIALIDLLMDAGASPGHSIAALANGNTEAAQHFIERGDPLTLVSAVCLEYPGEIDRLAPQAGADEKTTALIAAAYFGKADTIKKLLDMNADPNGFPDAGSNFRSHATALHQAVSSGSLACVQLLADAGALLNVPDKIYNGTPMDWAGYLRRDAGDETRKNAFSAIENYLRSQR